MKNLVMGAAKGYGWNTLESFVSSCRKNCPSAQIVLFFDNVSDFTRDRLARFGVQIVKIPAEYSGAVIVNSRWKLFADFLEEAGGDYEQVLVADTRDVIFQGDLFEPFKNHSSYLGYSTEKNLIGEDRRYTYLWIGGLCGKAEADKLADKKTICCGTINGTSREMKIFCDKMCEILKDSPVWGYDQAAINYLVHENLLPIENLIEIDVESGEIFTNGTIEESKTRGDYILRGDGGVPAVVHQYDRHSDLVELVDRLYRDGDFQADERFTDPLSGLDQILYLLHFDKVNDAAQFFMQNFIDGADFDSNFDRPMKIWENVLNRPLTPAGGYLELSMQVVLMSVKSFQLRNLKDVCDFLVHSMKNHRAVYPPFVEFAVNVIMNIARQSFNANSPADCLYCIDMINSLGLPISKNFYLFAAQANSTFGRRAEAEKAYQKAMESE